MDNQRVSTTNPDSKKSSKPVMEKRRRARINASLAELKSLLLDAIKMEGSRHSKMEKADILELAVRHLKDVQKNPFSAATNPSSSVLSKYIMGFQACTAEVSKYLSNGGYEDFSLKSKLLNHLADCLAGGDDLPNSTEISSSTLQIPSLTFKENNIIPSCTAASFISSLSSSTALKQNAPSWIVDANTKETAATNHGLVSSSTQHSNLGSSQYSSTPPSPSPLAAVTSPETPLSSSLSSLATLSMKDLTSVIDRSSTVDTRDAHVDRKVKSLQKESVIIRSKDDDENDLSFNDSDDDDDNLSSTCEPISNRDDETEQNNVNNNTPIESKTTTHKSLPSTVPNPKLTTAGLTLTSAPLLTTQQMPFQTISENHQNSNDQDAQPIQQPFVFNLQQQLTGMNALPFLGQNIRFLSSQTNTNEIALILPANILSSSGSMQKLYIPLLQPQTLNDPSTALLAPQLLQSSATMPGIPVQTLQQATLPSIPQGQQHASIATMLHGQTQQQASLSSIPQNQIPQLASLPTILQGQPQQQTYLPPIPQGPTLHQAATLSSHPHDPALQSNQVTPDISSPNKQTPDTNNVITSPIYQGKSLVRKHMSTTDDSHNRINDPKAIQDFSPSQTNHYPLVNCLPGLHSNKRSLEVSENPQNHSITTSDNGRSETNSNFRNQSSIDTLDVLTLNPFNNRANVQQSQYSTQYHIQPNPIQQEEKNNTETTEQCETTIDERPINYHVDTSPMCLLSVQDNIQHRDDMDRKRYFPATLSSHPNPIYSPDPSSTLITTSSQVNNNYYKGHSHTSLNHNTLNDNRADVDLSNHIPPNLKSTVHNKRPHSPPPTKTYKRFHPDYPRSKDETYSVNGLDLSVPGATRGNDRAPLSGNKSLVHGSGIKEASPMIIGGDDTCPMTEIETRQTGTPTATKNNILCKGLLFRPW